MSFLGSALLLIIFCFSSGELFGMEIVANDGAQGDYFGYAVAISGDYAIVGAHNNSENDIKSGAAYIFKRDGDSWVQMQKLVADDAENGDQFGFAVSISGDYAIVGANYKTIESIQTGAAYIFKRTGESWSQIQKIIANDGQHYDQFGYAVSIDGDCAIVGAPFVDPSNQGKIYIFQQIGDEWIQTTQQLSGNINDWYGRAVSIYNNNAIVGIPNYDSGDSLQNVGLVYIFKYENKSLNVLSTHAMNIKNQKVGDSVSISNNYAIIGTGDHTTASIYKKNGNSWNCIKHINVNVYSVSIADDYAIIGGNNNAYIYHNEDLSKEIIKINYIDDDNNSCFGHSVSISNDTYIIGAYNKNNSQGAVYINTVNNVKDCQLTGYVLDINKNPIEEITINSTLYGTTTTDNTGYYSLNGSCLPSDQLCLYDRISLTKGNISYYDSEACYWGRKSQKFTIQSYTISGYIKDSANQPIQGVIILFSNEGGETLTDENGFYRHTVYQGWNGKASAFGHGYQFEPYYKTYSNIKENHTDQNYTGKKMNISGYVSDPNHQPIKDVQLTFTNPDRTITTGVCNSRGKL